MSISVKPTLARTNGGDIALVSLITEDGVTYLSLECSAELRANLEICEEQARAVLAMTPVEQDLLAAPLGGRA